MERGEFQLGRTLPYECPAFIFPFSANCKNFTRHEINLIFFSACLRVNKKGYVNLVPVVADLEITIDASLVDVTDDGHVRHAGLRART